MRDARSAVLLCVVVAVAGCSAVPGVGDDGDGLAAGDEVPGVEDGRLADASTLLAAHVAVVTDTGFSQTVSTNLTDAADGETFRITQRQRTSVAAGATEYRYQTITDARFSSRVIAWGNDSVEYRRGETGGGDPQYQRHESTSRETLAGVDILEGRLSGAFEAVAVREREDAPDVVTLEVSGLPENNTVFDDEDDVEDVRQFEAQLVVDIDGRIHSYAAAGVYTIEGERAEYDFQFQMTSFDDPDVEKPDWVDDVEG